MVKVNFSRFILLLVITALFACFTVNTAFADSIVNNTDEELVAQSFIENYYSSIYLNDKFDNSYIQYDELRQYIETKINYKKQITPNVENLSIQMDLITKKEVSNVVYMAFFVEAEYNYVDMTIDSGFGECVQIVVDKKSGYTIRDFFINDNWDNKFRDINSINATNNLWENKLYGTELVENIQDRTVACIEAIEEQSDNVCVLQSDQSNNYSLNAVSASNRSNIVDFAVENCNKAQPASGNPDLVSSYFDFSNYSGAYDCTNFSSHCLLAGGASFKDSDDRYEGWFYYGMNMNDRSASWSSVVSFYDFATTNTGTGPKANSLTLRYNCPSSYINYNVGDFIQVDYEDDGVFDHTLIITSIAGNTSSSLYPYVTGRSGYSSGLNMWYVKNEQIMVSYADCEYRVLAFTSLT